MLNDSPLSDYEFRFVDEDPNSYYFTTVNEITYEVRFVPSAYLFEEYIEHYVDAYEMIIAVADNPTGGRLPADALIAPTIRAIFYDFFRSNEQVIVFICDSFDGRQKARMRKFMNWYYTDIQRYFFKVDIGIPDLKGDILVSAILKVQNPYFSQFVKVFESFGTISK